MNDKCEFKNCKKKATHRFYLGDVMNRYCNEHKNIIKLVLTKHDISILGKKKYMTQKRMKKMGIFYRKGSGEYVISRKNFKRFD